MTTGLSRGIKLLGVVLLLSAVLYVGLRPFFEDRTDLGTGPLVTLEMSKQQVLEAWGRPSDAIQNKKFDYAHWWYSYSSPNPNGDYGLAALLAFRDGRLWSISDYKSGEGVTSMRMSWGHP